MGRPSDPAVDDAKRFYSQLFGWDTRDQPLPMGGAYTTCTVRGRSIAGMGPQPQNLKGAPASWSCYVNVDDVDAIARRVTEHGGKVLMPAMDVMTEGRMLRLEDPSGAALGCWQPRNQPGAQLMREPSALCWFELLTRDVARATTFLSAVFGWKFRPSPEYSEILLGDDAIGGVMLMPKQVPALVPPSWSPYFTVVDVAATCEKTTALGGKVLMSPTNVAKVGTFVVLSDPQGAMFDVIAMT